MFSSFSSNVVLAKIRSLYSRRILREEYDFLLSCKSVGEVAVFLKKHAGSWIEILSNMKEKEIHRTELEKIIKKKVFEEAIRICRYEFSTGDNFAEYIVKRLEIEQIIHTLRMLLAHRAPYLNYSAPIFFVNHSKIISGSLTKVKNYKEFLDSIKTSIYKKILFKFENEFEKKASALAKIEKELYTHLFGYIYETIKKYKKSKTRKEMSKIFDFKIDFYNFARIVRLKNFYKTNPKDILDLMLPFGSLGQRTLAKMANSETMHDAISIMKTTRIGKKIEKTEYTTFDYLSNIFLSKICGHFIRFSSNPAVVMVSYLTLVEIELSNVITILEGIRYSVPSEKIFKLLVLEKN